MKAAFEEQPQRGAGRPWSKGPEQVLSATSLSRPELVPHTALEQDHPNLEKLRVQSPHIELKQQQRKTSGPLFGWTLASEQARPLPPLALR